MDKEPVTRFHGKEKALHRGLHASNRKSRGRSRRWWEDGHNVVLKTVNKGVVTSLCHSQKLSVRRGINFAGKTFWLAPRT